MRKLDADTENEINKIRWERWRAKQKTEREKTCFYCWDQWQECPGSGYCHSASGAYVDFYIRCWHSGASDCGEGLEAGRQRYAYINNVA